MQLFIIIVALVMTIALQAVRVLKQQGMTAPEIKQMVLRTLRLAQKDEL